MTRLFRRGPIWLAVVCLALASGCGGGKTRVTGKVTHKQKPVVWGAVTLVASDGVQYSGMINQDGTYSIDGVPSGPVKIGVSSDDPYFVSPLDRGGDAAAGSGDRPVQKDPGPPKPAKGAWFPIPDKYGDPMQSGLTGTIKSGEPLNIDLQ